jgi:Flp pilus assembly protein TadG
MHDAGESTMKLERQPMTRKAAFCVPARFAAAGLKQLQRDDGSNIVEYGIVFILFATMLFGIAGFGHALYAYHFVSHAAREATRWASVNGSTCASDSSCTAPAKGSDVTTFVDNIVPMGVNSSNVAVNTSWPSTAGVCAATSNAPGCAVKVQVSYNFSFILPLIHTNAITVSSSSQMLISH